MDGQHTRANRTCERGLAPGGIGLVHGRGPQCPGAPGGSPAAGDSSCFGDRWQRRHIGEPIAGVPSAPSSPPHRGAPAGGQAVPYKSRVAIAWRVPPVARKRSRANMSASALPMSTLPCMTSLVICSATNSLTSAYVRLSCGRHTMRRISAVHGLPARSRSLTASNTLAVPKSSRPGAHTDQGAVVQRCVSQRCATVTAIVRSALRTVHAQAKALPVRERVQRGKGQRGVVRRRPGVQRQRVFEMRDRQQHGRPRQDRANLQRGRGAAMRTIRARSDLLEDGLERRSATETPPDHRERRRTAHAARRCPAPAAKAAGSTTRSLRGRAPRRTRPGRAAAWPTARASRPRAPAAASRRGTTP